MDIQKKEGTFRRTKSGKAYVSITEKSGAENIPVMVTYADDVYDGDTVVVFSQTSSQKGEREDQKKLGKIQKVIKKATTSVTGEVFLAGKKAFLSPDSYIPFRIPIKAEKDSVKCHDGDKIQALLTKYKAVSAMRAVPVKNFGSAKSFEANFSAAIFGTRLFESFPPQAEKQALGTSPVEAKNFTSKRMDLRSKPIFTFTDSVFGGSGCGFSVDKTDGGYRLSVHVADVPEYLPAFSPLDAEAAKRGRQVLGHREGSPLFPPGFVNSVCSFGESREFLAVSTFIDYDEAGNAIHIDFAETVISPVLAAAAADVDALISGADSSALMPLRQKYSAIGEQIGILYELAGILRAKRIEKGGVDFEICERMYILSQTGTVRSSSLECKNDSSLMVSEILISVGKSAAEKLFYAGHPCVYASLAEKLYDDITGYPELMPLLKEEDLSLPGHTQKAMSVSRGTSFEKFYFEKVTLECDTPSLSVSPSPHYVFAAERHIEYFRPAQKYSNLINLRGIKAFVNDMPFDLSKFVPALSAEEKAGEVQAVLVKLYSLGCLASQIGFEHEGVAAESSDGVKILLDCGVVCSLDAHSNYIAGDLEIGSKIKVIVTEVDLSRGKAAVKPVPPRENINISTSEEEKPKGGE
ncbi:MAG: RNB domain-containing ribonuclease [Eubacteriales bacterium]